MKQERLTARDVAEYLLERTGTSLMSGDFETFASCFLIPQEMQTFSGTRHVETLDELREVFDAVRQHFQNLNVTEVHRKCVEAQFRDDHTITTTHLSRPLSGATMVQNPYPAFSIVKRTSDGWKIASSQYAISDSPGLIRAVTG